MNKNPTFICLALMIAVFICGCTDKTVAEVTSKKGKMSYYNYETDCQLNISNPPLESCVAKGSDGYFIINDGYLYFADLKSRSATVLCNKPNCLHDSMAYNTDCYAYIGIEEGLTYNEGYIYYLSPYAQSDTDINAIIRISADGSGVRKKIYSNEYNTSKWIVHREYLYNAYYQYQLEDGFEDISRSRLVIEKVPLNGSTKPEIVYDSVDFLNYSSFDYLAAFDNYLYYSYDYYAEDERVEKLCCYSLDNNSEKEITLPKGDINSGIYGMIYIYPLGDELIFKVGATIYRCDLNADNIKMAITLEDEYHNIFTDGVYLFEDNFANFVNSELLSIKKADSRILKVYDSDFNLVDVIDVENYNRYFKAADDKCFIDVDSVTGKISYFNKACIGSKKDRMWHDFNLE